MKSRVALCAQLFVLTHNFLFFRQVRNWFKYLRKRKENVQFYMLQTKMEGADRSAILTELDPLLTDFESEYHYLFSLVYRASNESDNGHGLAHSYYLPNVARRLIEAFLEFKVPGMHTLHARLDKIEFDSAKKTRIFRFCNSHSHSKTIDDVEQDPVILSEADRVAGDILELIEAVDRGHFEQMVELVERVASD